MYVINVAIETVHNPLDGIINNPISHTSQRLPHCTTMPLINASKYVTGMVFRVNHTVMQGKTMRANGSGRDIAANSLTENAVGLCFTCQSMGVLSMQMSGTPDPFPPEMKSLCLSINTQNSRYWK